VSVTTRPMRPGEINGEDYIFVSSEEFNSMRDEGDLLEWALVFDNFYGTLGREEIETISPAIEKLKAKGLDVRGPLPADAVFQERIRGTYDAIIAMYHDQALIPVKTLAFDRTVNVTLGLPIIRTSPDHGTAYELAGTGKANPGSLMESLRLAQALGLGELAST